MPLLSSIYYSNTHDTRRYGHRAQSKRRAIGRLPQLVRTRPTNRPAIPASECPYFSSILYTQHTRREQVRAPHTKQAMNHPTHTAACAHEANNSPSISCQRAPLLFLHLIYSAHIRREQVRAPHTKQAMSHWQATAACAHEANNRSAIPASECPYFYTFFYKHTHTDDMRKYGHCIRTQLQHIAGVTRGSSTRATTHPATPASACPYFSSLYYSNTHATCACTGTAHEASFNTSEG